MARYITHNHEKDGVDQRGFLKCMAWAGTGVVWTLAGGTAHGQMAGHGKPAKGDLSFVQISDSHIGFNKEANPDVKSTLEAAVAKINAMAEPPAFLIHTGDISHLSKPEEFATASSILATVRTGARFYVPGEHDVLTDNGKPYLERYGKNSRGNGWFSFDQKGVHFIGLVNVMDLKPGGLGSLGKGGRAHDLSHGLFDGVSATEARRGAFARTNEGAGRTIARHAGVDLGALRRGQPFAGGSGYHAGGADQRYRSCRRGQHR